MWKANQEFPSQSLESFSEEYYNMENKVLDFQFGPVCTNQTCLNYSVGSKQDEAEKSSMTDGIHQNGGTVKNVKRYQPVKNACCHKIQAVNAFHLKFKARLSWITAALKIFSLEVNCVENHFLEEFFSEIS